MHFYPTRESGDDALSELHMHCMFHIFPILLLVVVGNWISPRSVSVILRAFNQQDFPRQTTRSVAKNGGKKNAYSSAILITVLVYARIDIR